MNCEQVGSKKNEENGGYLYKVKWSLKEERVRVFTGIREELF